MFPHLHWCAEHKEEQVEDGEARQYVLFSGHGASMFLMQVIHNHHVDHEAHHRQAKDQAQQKGVLPSANQAHMSIIKHTIAAFAPISCTDGLFSGRQHW